MNLMKCLIHSFFFVDEKLEENQDDIDSYESDYLVDKNEES